MNTLYGVLVRKGASSVDLTFIDAQPGAPCRVSMALETFSLIAAAVDQCEAGEMASIAVGPVTDGGK